MGEGSDGPDLGRVLPELKRRGCTILITGEVNPTVSMRASRRLFGEPDADRVRVVGLTRQAAMRPNAWLPGDVETSDEAADLVKLAQPARAVADPGGERKGIGPVTRSLCTAVEDATDGRRSENGRLRVGVYSLLPLEGRYGTSGIEGFVGSVGERVRERGGMGHFHLPRADDDAVIDRIDPLFDVRMEVRQLAAADPVPEQRWHVDGEASPWVEL